MGNTLKSPKRPFYRISKSKDGQFFFELEAKNGKTVSNGETYKTLSGAKKGVESHRKIAATETIFIDIK